ncbi:unnamed protein product [Protopolystoma xenopodis]|uniref:Uncharacterized protein n=1 Tax=Protopolystoma xenopodis TaxID=117903 RepID=A0A448WP02_9PLAT|nr:unnamed protein product [Protopolystoma xenopodis]
MINLLGNEAEESVENEGELPEREFYVVIKSVKPAKPRGFQALASRLSRVQELRSELVEMSDVSDSSSSLTDLTIGGNRGNLPDLTEFNELEAASGTEANVDKFAPVESQASDDKAGKLTAQIGEPSIMRIRLVHSQGMDYIVPTQLHYQSQL